MASTTRIIKMSDLKQIVAIFNSTVTDNAIEDIKKKHDGLVHDFTNEESFKAAKKVRTEMNKLLERVDRVGIDSAQQVTDMRNELKERIESAYSGTVTPFLIENQSRIDEAKRIKKEKESRIYEQTQKLALMKGASARALHLPIDDIEDILQDVMGIDIESFDADMKDEAKAAKEISLAQLKDAFEFATQKEDMRKKQEIQAAELADKNDEIERMKAQIAAMTKQPEKELEATFFAGIESLELSLSSWFDENNISDSSIKELEEILINYIK